MLDVNLGVESLVQPPIADEMDNKRLTQVVEGM